MVAREGCLHAEDSLSLVAALVDSLRKSICDLDSYGMLPRGESRDAGAPESSSR
jgi:hypothetical protein